MQFHPKNVTRATASGAASASRAARATTSRNKEIMFTKTVQPQTRAAFGVSMFDSVKKSSKGCKSCGS